MTATQPAMPVCPECGLTNTMVMSDGMAQCFDDGTVWNPAEVKGIPRAQRPEAVPVSPANPAVMVGGAETTAGTVPPAVDESPMPGQVQVPVPADPLTPDDMIGGTARLEGGQVAVVLSFPDDEHVTVRLNDGRDETVPMSDVERITPRAPVQVIEAADLAHPPAEEPEVEPAPVTPEDETPANDLFAQASAEADRYVTALSAAIDAEGEGPLTEVAVTMTVARLMIAYEIGIDTLTEVLADVGNMYLQGDQQEEET